MQTILYTMAWYISSYEKAIEVAKFLQLAEAEFGSVVVCIATTVLFCYQCLAILLLNIYTWIILHNCALHHPLKYIG